MYRRRFGRILVLALLLAASVAVTPGLSAATYSLAYSRAANRTASVPLAGATVSGYIYAFTTPDTGVTAVSFYLDDPAMTAPPRRTETARPFDLAGGSVTEATPFDTRTLTEGSHTLTAKVTSGTSVEVTSAIFTVANRVTAPPSHTLSYSTAANRSGAQTLHSAATAGRIFAFVSPATGIVRVRFYVNDTAMTRPPQRIENFAPWDLAGGTTAAADPFDTNTLSNGSHTLTASVDLSAGSTTVIDATFTVQNTLTTPPPPPPPTGLSAFSWRDETPKAQRVFESNGMVADSKLYVFGGFIDSALTATTKSEAYSPATQSWSAVAPMPEAITHASAVFDKGAIWLLGGYVGNSPGPSTNRVWKYNIPANSWSAGPPLPADRSSGGAQIIGRTLHFFGGSTRSSAGVHDDTDRSEHWTLQLDSVSPVWSPAPAMPNPRNHFGVASVGTKLYAIGGQHAHDEGTSSQLQVDIYDTLSKSWSRGADLPLARSHIQPSVSVHNGRIMSFGGTKNNGALGAPISDVSVYDPASNTWVGFPPLPGVRKAPVAGIINGRVYVATGNSGTGTATATTWSAPLSQVWETLANAPISLGEVAGGIIGSTMYLVGEGSSATLAYNLATRTWRPDASQAVRPLVGHHTAAEVVGGKLYLFGGLGAGQGKIQIYDPMANTWSAGAAMPFAAGSASSAVIGGKVYVAGGIIGNSTTAQAAVYTPSTNTWQSIAPMPQGRNHAASSTDGSRLYIFGGRGAGSGDGNTVANGFDTVQIYDPASNTWQSSLDPGSTLKPLPVARGGTGKAVYSGAEFYVMGGETSTGAGAVTGNVYNRVDVYKPTSNTWRTTPSMITARHGIFPMLLNGRIYVALGGVTAAASTSSVNEAYFIE